MPITASHHDHFTNISMVIRNLTNIGLNSTFLVVGLMYQTDILEKQLRW